MLLKRCKIQKFLGGLSAPPEPPDRLCMESGKGHSLPASRSSPPACRLSSPAFRSSLFASRLSLLSPPARRFSHLACRCRFSLVDSRLSLFASRFSRIASRMSVWIVCVNHAAGIVSVLFRSICCTTIFITLDHYYIKMRSHPCPAREMHTYAPGDKQEAKSDNREARSEERHKREARGEE